MKRSSAKSKDPIREAVLASAADVKELWTHHLLLVLLLAGPTKWMGNVHWTLR